MGYINNKRKTLALLTAVATLAGGLTAGTAYAGGGGGNRPGTGGSGAATQFWQYKDDASGSWGPATDINSVSRAMANAGVRMDDSSGKAAAALADANSRCVAGFHQRHPGEGDGDCRVVAVGAVSGNGSTTSVWNGSGIADVSIWLDNWNKYIAPGDYNYAGTRHYKTSTAFDDDPSTSVDKLMERYVSSTASIIIIALDKYQPAPPNYDLTVTTTHKQRTNLKVGSTDPIGDTLHASNNGSSIKENLNGTAIIHYEGQKNGYVAAKTVSKPITFANSGDTQLENLATPADFGMSHWQEGQYWIDIQVAKQGRMNAAVDTTDKDPSETWTVSAEPPTPPTKTIDEGVSADSMTNRTVITYGTGKGGYEMTFKDKITANGVDYTVDDYKLVDKTDNDRDASNEFTITWDRKTDTVSAVRTADKGEMPLDHQYEFSFNVTVSKPKDFRKVKDHATGKWNQEPEADAGSKEFDTWQPNPDKSWIFEQDGEWQAVIDPQETNKTGGDSHTYLDGDKVGSVVNGTVGRNLIQAPKQFTLTDDWTAADYIFDADTKNIRVYEATAGTDRESSVSDIVNTGKDVTDQFDITVQDINYQLSPESHQMEIIDRWAKLINSFEAGQNVQIASYTRSRGVREILADVMMGETGDSLDHYRLDYNRLAQGKLESVSRNTSTVKTLTVTVRESDEQAAVATLNALCNNLVSQMRSIDACKATRLDREHRLRLMAEVLRPGEEFRFDERRFEHQPGKPDTKDLVCPWSIDARNPTMLDIESLDSKYLHRTMWVSSLPPELSDQLVNDLTGLRARVDVSIHLAPMDRGESMTLVRRKNAEVKMQIMDQRRKNRKQGLDPDDLPDDLADQQEQLGQLRDELRSTNQRLVDSIIVIGVSAASQEELEVACRNVKAKVNAQSCTAESLKFMQMEGLTAELPLGNNPLPMKRTLTTNSAAILIPFTTQEVFEPHGLFYGSNARSGNPILADRRSHMNSNGFVLGTSGGGKSFTVKQEIAGMFLNRDDEVIVIDPEREYLALAAAFGGQIIQISAGTGTRVNPMDIVLEDDSASDPVKDKTNNVVSMIGALIGGIDGLDPLQKGLVDQCVSNLYTRYRNQGGGVVQPTLQDLHDELQAGGDQVSRYLADALNPYITGSMSGFNGQTNVDLSNRFTVFDVSGLSGELRTFGMMVVIDQVWNRVIRNKANGRRTWLYVDEFHRFFSNQYAAAQFKDIYKRARKYGLGVTGITQNVEEILDLQDAREMLSNSDFLMLLSQNSTDADALCELLTLSEEQRQYFTGVLPGQGLMKIGSAYVPFDGRIPAGGDLYRLYSTTFQEGK